MAKNIEFDTPRLTDQEVFNQFNRLAEKRDNPERLTINTPVGGLFNGSWTEATQTADTRTAIDAWLSQQLALANFSLQFSEQFSISYVRDLSGVFDKVRLTFPDPTVPEDSVSLISDAQTVFETVQPSTWIGALLGEDAQRYYDAREANLVRLEGLSQRIIEQNEAYRTKVDQEKVDFEQAIRKKYDEKSASLESREKGLDEREEQMDLADAKSVRRKLRQEILKKISDSDAFKVSKDTSRKSWPIHLVFVVITGVLGVDIWYQLYIVKPTFVDIAESIRFAIPVAALVGFALLYFRWNDAWFRRNVDEEIRLQRLALDVDRASWVVELISELSSELGEDETVSQELIEAFVRNLFAEPGESSAVSHPAEDVLTTLLGSAKEAEVRLPGGKLRLGKRELRKLGDDSEEQH